MDGWSEKELDQLVALSERYPALRPLRTTRSFLRTGRRHVHCSLFWAEDRKAIVGLAHFGSETEGFPRCVHGACSTAVAETAMLGCATHALSAPYGSCSTLSVKFRKFIPLGTSVVVEARCASIDGPRATVECRLKDPAGTLVYWEGTGTFVGLLPPPPAPTDPPPPTATKRRWWPF